MSIAIKFNADATGVHSALAGVTGQIDGLKEEMSGLSWADFAMGAARGLFEAVIAPAAEMEQYMVRFETVLGSAAQAAAYMQQLTDYANSTPFELSELADAASTLLSFGTSAEKSVAVLKQLGDMAAVTGASVTELASICGKVGSVGFETESVNQLASRGLNVRAIWAKRDGISEAEVQKNIFAKKYGPDARCCTARHGLLPSAGGGF
ncbi:MAG: phage tail tape measure protein [Akkermansia sp.]|nr:phage tail tape measure protein [Akkermansia sp.]